MIYRVCVKKYGYVEIREENEYNAIMIAENDMTDRDFDWSDICEAEVVEEIYDD